MNKLHTINAEDLQNRTYEPTHFLVDELGSAYALHRGSRCGILQ